jgi:hypothetical protein
MSGPLSRRAFTKLSTAAAGAAAASVLTTGAAGAVGASAADDDKLQSEFLLDLVIETQPANVLGPPAATRVIVPVSGGTFEGPKLKGSIAGPGGDWIVQRSDGSSVLDVRLVLQTDDAQKIYVTWRGISYTPAGGTQYARITPMFETGAARYAWLNNIVSVGVHRPMPGKVAYRVYQIL